MNDQHQEYIDHAGHDTRGPGAAIRARIGAQALRSLADRVEVQADRSGWPTMTDFNGNPFRPTLSVVDLRTEADRLLVEVGIPRCTATSIQGYTCLHPTNHHGPHEARPTVIRWTTQEPA